MPAVGERGGSILWLTALLCLPAAVWAACSTPDGQAGSLIYNADENVVQFCGTDDTWYNAGSPSPTTVGTVCTTPDGNEGALIYNESEDVYQFCNGSVWVNTACPDLTGGSGGCTGPEGDEGAIIFSNTANKVQFCDGDNWFNFGSQCGATCDPYFDDTVLLLHMDGADASTTFTDDSGSTHTVTANNDAQIDTSASKYGGASGLFDGTGDYLSLANNADWQFGSGDFTIEFWLKSTMSTTAYVATYVNNGNFNAGWYIALYNGGIFFGVNNSAFTIVTTPDTINDGIWHHVAVVRNGSSFKVFIDGEEDGEETYASAITVPSIAPTLIIGRNYLGYTNNVLDGSLDDFRITKGVPRYTGNFAIPSVYPDSGCE